MRRIYEWYKGLKGYKKIIASFVVNWLYWAFVYMLIYYVITAGEEQTRSIKDYLFSVTFCAALWTLFDNINYKKLFRNSSKDQKVQVSDTRDDQQ